MIMRTTEIEEGSVRLIVPDLSVYKIPNHAPVFYNPVMKTSRDISVSLAKVIGMERMIDPLSGTGVRALRYAKEAGCTVVANDHNPKAFELIERNIQLNNLSGKVSAYHRDANSVMNEMQGKFTGVDIDPFGSPLPFIESGLRTLGRKGLITITATDTAPLSGVYVKTCLRRYGSRPLKTEYHHEIGVRILTYVLARYAVSQDRSLTPILAHATQHYYKIFALTESSATRADRTLENIGYLYHCPKCDFRSTETDKCPCGSKMQKAGPLWIGDLWDKKILGRIKVSGEAKKIIDVCISESELPPFYYDLHHLCKKHKKECPSFEKLEERITEKGYKFSRTHFSPYGFRSDMQFEELKKII